MSAKAHKLGSHIISGLPERRELPAHLDMVVRNRTVGRLVVKYREEAKEPYPPRYSGNNCLATFLATCASSSHLTASFSVDHWSNHKCWVP